MFRYSRETVLRPHGHRANQGREKEGRRREEEPWGGRVNALCRASQAHSRVNSRDTILRLVKDQAHCESGITFPE